MRTRSLAVAIASFCVFASTAHAASVFRVLEKTQRAVFKLSDDEILQLEEGSQVTFTSPSGESVSGRVVKLTESRALVKVASGFSSLQKNKSFALAAEGQESRAGVTRTPSYGSGSQVELGTKSPSPFANEFHSANEAGGLQLFGKEEAAFIARVPHYQAGLQYQHLVSLDASFKTDDPDSETEAKSKGGSSIEVTGVVHLSEKFWLGAIIRQTENKLEFEDKESDTKSSSQGEVQQITLSGAWLVKPKWVLGLALDNVKDDFERKNDAGKADDNITYNRVRSSVAYYGPDYELVGSHRATVNIDEGVNSISEPAQLKVEGEKYVSTETSLRGTLAYVWYNRANQSAKNTLVPSFGIVHRLGTSRLEAELLYKTDNYRDEGESLGSVRTVELSLGYFHMFTPEVEGLAGLDYINANGGDDIEIEGSILTALVGVNYKG